MTTLQAGDLEFAYNSRPVLRRISATIRPGRLTAIIGPNGSGKSTLLRCLNRILKPAQGSLHIDGRALSELTIRELARRIGYAPQNGFHNGSVTVAEVVLLGRRPHLRFRVGPEDRARVREALAELGITDLAGRGFDQLSGGEKQKALLARALAQETRFLLLDEPTSNLDPRHQLEVLNLLTKLKNDRRMGLAVVLHDLNLAARYADDMVLLHQGRAAARGAPEEVLTPDNLARVYGVEAVIDRDGRGRLRLDIVGPLTGAKAPESTPLKENGHAH